MSNTLIFLQLEHGSIVKLLSLLEVHAEQIEGGEDPNLDMLRLAFEYFRDYPDACHHPKEDVVFRRLLDRAPTAAVRVGDLLGDHELLARRTLAMITLVRELERGRGPTGRDLAEEIRGFAQIYRQHLDAEDQYFFPAVAQCLERDDWDLIDFTVFDAADPLFDDVTESRFAALRRAIWAHAEEDDEGLSSAGTS